MIPPRLAVAVLTCLLTAYGSSAQSQLADGALVPIVVIGLFDGPDEYVFGSVADGRGIQ